MFSRHALALLGVGFLAGFAVVCGSEGVFAQSAKKTWMTAEEAMAGDPKAYRVGDKVLYSQSGGHYRVGTITSVAGFSLGVRDDFFKRDETVPMANCRPYLNLKVGEKVCWLDSWGAFKTGEVTKVSGERISVKEAEKANGKAAGKAPRQPLPAGIGDTMVDLSALYLGDTFPADRFTSLDEIEIGDKVGYFDTWGKPAIGTVIEINKTFKRLTVKPESGNGRGSSENCYLKDLRKLNAGGGEGTEGPEGAVSVYKKSNWSAAKDIWLYGDFKDVPTSFTPGAAKDVPKLPGGEVRLPEVEKASKVELVDVVGPERSIGVVAYTLNDGVAYALVDMKAGKVIAGPTKLETGRIVAASPDGTRLACDGGELMTIWKINGEKPEKVLSFKAWHPGGGDKWTEKDRLFFINNERLVAICGKRFYVGWDISKAPTVVWKAEPSLDSVGDVDPARTAVFVPNQNRSQVLDPLTGEVKAAMLTQPFWESAHFSPSGKRIHSRTQWEYTIMDLTNTASRVKYLLQDLQWGMGEAPHWLGSETTLLGQNKVFNTRLGVYIGTFDKGAWPLVTPDGRLIGVMKKGGYFLTDAMAQTPEMVAAAAKLTPEQTLYYKSGDKISIEVNAGLVNKGNQRAKARLLEQLKAHGVEVADGRPVKLVVSVIELPQSKMSYRVGSEPARDLVYTPVEYRVELFSEGKSVWKKSMQFRGGRQKPNQTGEQFLKDAREESDTFVDVFEVPRAVPRPEKELGIF